jgi:hypothetical protein
MKDRVNRLLKNIAAVAKEVWNSAEESGFCCGIRLDCRTCESMPTPSSCCGVRL